MFEETNAVTQSLAQQADQLAKAMDGFRLAAATVREIADEPQRQASTSTMTAPSAAIVAPSAIATGNLAEDTRAFEDDGWEHF